MEELSICDRGPAPRCPAPFNLARHVMAAGQQTPDKVALAILGLGRAERWSFARLEAAIRGTATGLLDAGLQPGQRILLRLGNEVDFPLAFLGAICAGLVPVPTSAQLTARELAEVIAIAEPAALVLGRGLETDPSPALPVIAQDALRKMRDLPPADWQMGDPERPAYIVFTSGTSGSPRAVVHAHRALWARQMMHEGWYGLRPDDRLLHAGAFNWTYTLGTGLLDPWSLGATALIPVAGLATETLPLLLKRHEATLFAAAPGVYRKLLSHHPTLDLPKLRHGLSAGEKLSATLREAWREASGKPIHEAFGMSEISTFLSGCPSDPAPEGTLGRPQPGRHVAILGDAGPLPLGQPGTIAVHRSDPGLMLGYLGAPEATAERFRDEWFLTGDLGAMDASGAVTYLGRRGEMLNAGGYRVSPLEIEAALADLPGVTEIAVTEVEVKQDARVIAAFYTGQAQDDLTLSALAEARLARYKQPRIWRHVAALPRNANGKLQRAALAALWENGHDGQA
ncbi:Acyl-CoA synthetase (AMP-forming)/AMP-acid ligase II [Pseudooceanicola antarcticus]|uniref:Acyl-CoA synthetase (AMP-forming)/AMP-acid ligase II n=1 Tax=Pseudooceanicola antarcticus TaxID=1247613 RepID=A0A285IWJ6_9RHOB|nr:class I adenylate-forming enzyme family protein [Pseudooceanicola antarcticus]PJE25902.1 long-chain fatty acid--CoA ligase [Pseudooceanicola antarcticus]SNY52420.1 Acyl-CoA synthetase (AMP-forming)/AMP-acid ligase II [Pseudooceanicola antarcticus]